MDSPLEEWLIKEAGVRTSSEWISACIQWIAANNPNQLSPVELQHAVLERWLTTDIAESSLPILGNDQFTTLTNMALQVNWVYDVSTSAYRQLQLLRGQDIEAGVEEGGTPAGKRAKMGTEQTTRPSRMLLAEMTDGHSVVNAIEYQPMGPELHEDIPPGTKVHLLAAVCKKGTILLIPGCLRVLGGGVESMVKVNSLESLLQRALEQAKQTPREPFGGQPQREPFGGQPQREPFRGQPQREPFRGQPQREPFGEQPQREPFRGQPQREPFGEQPQREPFGGQPQREPFRGQPQRELFGGQPQREPLGGQPQREPFGGQPQREPLGGQPQREPFRGQPQREPLGEQPQREPLGEQPQRELLGGQPQREPFRGQPQREPLGEQPQREPLGEQPQRERSGGQPHNTTPVCYKSGLMSPGQSRWGQRGDLPLRMQSSSLASYAGNVDNHESDNFASLGRRKADKHSSAQPRAGDNDTSFGSPTSGPHSPWDTGATIPTHPVGHTPHPQRPGPHSYSKPLPHEVHPHRSQSPQPHHSRHHSPGPHLRRSHSPGPHGAYPYRPLPPGPRPRRSLSPGPHPHRPFPPQPRFHGRHSPVLHLHRPHSPGPHPHRPHSPGLHPHRPHSPGLHPHRHHSPGPHPHRHHSPGPHPHRHHSPGPCPPGIHTNKHITWDAGGIPRPHPRPQINRRATEHHNGDAWWSQGDFPGSSGHKSTHPHQRSHGFHSSGGGGGPPWSGH